LKGVKKPWECKVFGTACTPETPIGSCMVLSEGACAAYYNFGRLSKVAERSGLNARPWRATWKTMAEEFTASPLFARVERARRRKARIRETNITLAHGSGGKAMHELIEGLFLEYLRTPCWRC
jgi:hypothetical protein